MSVTVESVKKDMAKEEAKKNGTSVKKGDKEKSDKPKGNKKKKLLIVAGIVALAIGGYYVYKSFEKKPTPNLDIPENSPSVDPSPNKVGGGETAGMSEIDIENQMAREFGA